MIVFIRHGANEEGDRLKEVYQVPVNLIMKKTKEKIGRRSRGPIAETREGGNSQEEQEVSQ